MDHIGSHWFLDFFWRKQSPGGLSTLGMWRQGIKLRELHPDSENLCIAMHLIEQIPFFRLAFNCFFIFNLFHQCIGMIFRIPTFRWELCFVMRARVFCFLERSLERVLCVLKEGSLHGYPPKKSTLSNRIDISHMNMLCFNGKWITPTVLVSFQGAIFLRKNVPQIPPWRPTLPGGLESMPRFQGRRKVRALDVGGRL